MSQRKGALKILFLVHAMSRTRHFESVLQQLAQEGHTVRIAAVAKKGGVRVPPGLKHPRISVVECPSNRHDAWEQPAERLRSFRDYVRYRDPRFANSASLLRRAQAKAPREFLNFCQRNLLLRHNWKLVAAALSMFEHLTPGARPFEAFLRRERPDLVLVTPLVHFGSYQTDYVKAAHRLGLPVAYLPFSWDNLTNRGLIRIVPDRVLVWNDIQKREAVDLHGVPPDQVVVTGAPRFDEFFDLRPSSTRDEFCARVGLAAERPYIVYLCSSRFVAGEDEANFVRRWIGEIRRSGRLQACGVLVRPHPANTEQWRTVDLSGLPDVAIQAAADWKNTDQDLFDALHHSAAVVGLNTSALLEAGILGKSVHTVLAPEFAVGQQGTLHFQYLLRQNGGPLSVARTFDEHRRHLAAALDNAAAGREQSLRFVRAFLRPHGLDQPATPIMAEAIKRVAEIQKRPRGWTPLWHFPARSVLLSFCQQLTKAEKARKLAERERKGSVAEPQAVASS